MPLLVTADDITSAIIRIDAAAQGVDAVIASCKTLDTGTQQAWAAWYKGWQSWAKANSNLGYFTLGLPAIGNQAVGYENDIAGWIDDADRLCGSRIPIYTPQTDVANQNSSTPNGWDNVISAVRWTATAVIAALIVPPVIELIHNYHDARKARKLQSKRG